MSTNCNRYITTDYDDVLKIIKIANMHQLNVINTTERYDQNTLDGHYSLTTQLDQIDADDSTQRYLDIELKGCIDCNAFKPISRNKLLEDIKNWRNL